MMKSTITINYDQLYCKVPFISHIDTDPPMYWLAMNINHKPVEELRQTLEKKFCGLNLLTRGEAHITIITPIEYENILKQYITPQEIDNIAVQHNVQLSKFTLLCIGKGVSFSEIGKQIETYFIVVKSQDLVKIRKKIFDLYIKNGGIPSRFDPKNFTPHITAGFTERDLFQNDGVYKQENSCILKVCL